MYNFLIENFLYGGTTTLKRTIRKAMSILLIIVGIFLLMTPFITNLIIKYQSKNISTDNLTAEDIEKNNEAEVEFDFSSIEDVDINTAINVVFEPDESLVIGELEIPDLNIHLPILKGLTNSNLLAGAGTMKPNQIMGRGNYPLAGHIMKNKDLLFGSLMDIKVGTIVTITDKKNIYKYKIYDTVVVPDTAVEILSDEEAEKRGKPIISLMTCYYSSKTGKRFFALGELYKEWAPRGGFEVSPR